MKYNVHFTAGHHRLSEEIHANDPGEAKKVILARNPNATNITVTGPRPK